MRIDIWSDIACPWCFIGLTRFEKALAEFEHADQVELRLRSFQLDPSLPASFEGSEAEYLASAKGLDEESVKAMVSRVAAVAAEDGLVMDFDSLKVANSRRAHRLLQFARGQGGDLELEKALFLAHFSQGLSIGDPEVLVGLAVAVGLDPEGARDAIEDADLDAAVSADVDLARQYGISGVPTFVLADKYAISGAQPVAALTQALEQVWREAHPSLITVPGGVSGPACGPDGC